MSDLSDLTPQAPGKPDRWAAFRGLPKWQVVLVVVPLTLIAFGGLIGGAFGGLGMATNLKLARTNLATAPKALAMMGVVLAALAIYLVVAALLTTAIKS
ncbi:hypothetical protein ABIA33_002182 [Streptacidiphilus sp. MAP12-16]